MLLVVALVVGLPLPWSGTEVGAQQPDDHGDLLDNTATAVTLGTGRAGPGTWKPAATLMFSRLPLLREPPRTFGFTP